MEKRFEYFMNAMHYNMYLAHVWLLSLSIKYAHKSTSFTVKYIIRKKSKEKWAKIYAENEEKTKEYYFNKKNGLAINMTRYDYGFFSSMHISVILFPLLGLNMIFIEDCAATDWWVFPEILLIWSLGFIPIYKAALSKDRYLKFYKRFEKKDAQWHKKWKRTTILFFLGAVLSAAIGLIIVFCMFVPWKQMPRLSVITTFVVYALIMTKLIIEWYKTKNEIRSKYNHH